MFLKLKFIEIIPKINFSQKCYPLTDLDILFNFLLSSLAIPNPKSKKLFSAYQLFGNWFGQACNWNTVGYLSFRAI